MRPSELSCVTIMIASHANFVFTYASDFFEIKCRLCTKNHHVNFEMSHIYVESFSNYEQSVLCPVISCVNFKLSHLYLRQQGGCTAHNKPFDEYLFLYCIFKLNLRSFIEK